jgi:hypothetical protein
MNGTVNKGTLYFTYLSSNIYLKIVCIIYDLKLNDKNL